MLYIFEIEAFDMKTYSAWQTDDDCNTYFAFSHFTNYIYFKKESTHTTNTHTHIHK